MSCARPGHETRPFLVERGCDRNYKEPYKGNLENSRECYPANKPVIGVAALLRMKGALKSLITKQSLNVPRAMIDVKHLNTLWNGAVKNDVVVKTRNAP
jgi:hypothetical protein